MESTSSYIIKAIEFIDKIVNKKPQKYNDYYLTQSYNYLFTELMYNYLDNQVCNNYKDDFQGPFYQNFKNSVRFNSIKFANISDPFYQKDIELSNFFSDNLQNLIKKLCNILMLDYSISIEQDETLHNLYYINKLIIVYIELTRHQYEALELNTRQLFITQFNNFIKLPSGKITINSPFPNIMPLSSYLRYGDNSFGKLSKEEYLEFTKFIDKLYDLIKNKVIQINQLPNNDHSNNTPSINNKPDNKPDYKNAKKITKLYNNKLYNVSKDILIKACNIRELNISYAYNKNNLETTLFDSIKGKTLREKAKNLKLSVDEDVNENGLKIAIIENILESN